MMNKGFKSGFVGIIGAPNVGKSTLLNHFLQEHLVIVSPKAQTTRNAIKAIYTTDNEQIVFIDTPGVHKAFTELGEFMNSSVNVSLEGLDLVLFMVDVSTDITNLEKYAVSVLEKVKIPVVLVLNKIDLVEDSSVLEERINEYKKLYNFAGGITICAESGDNCNKLLEIITSYLPLGPMYYPDDQLLDAPMKFVVQEIIREKVLYLTKEEVPYGVAVVVESFKPNPKVKDMQDILATIVVERQSQKKIIIGAGGSMIKKIGMMARRDLVTIMGTKVYLELFVKVEENWRNNKSRLREYGYKIEK